MTFQATNDEEYPRITPAVQTLIAINVAIFFLQSTILNSVETQTALAFSYHDLPRRWWSIATYMFVHGSLLHIAMNMYTLWIFGPRLEYRWGARKFTIFYLASGLGGLLLYALFFRDSNALLLGASGAIFGVMGAYALLWPKQEVYLFLAIPMKVITLVLLLVAFNLAMGVASMAGAGGDVAYFAHLGGFVVAWVYLRTPSAVSIEQLRQRISQVPDTEDPPRAIPRTQSRPRPRMDAGDEVVAKSKALASKRPTAVVPVRKSAPRELEADDVNRVLDKISAEGLESLTSDERSVLEEMSRRLKDGPR